MRYFTKRAETEAAVMKSTNQTTDIKNLLLADSSHPHLRPLSRVWCDDNDRYVVSGKLELHERQPPVLTSVLIVNHNFIVLHFYTNLSQYLLASPVSSQFLSGALKHDIILEKSGSYSLFLSFYSL